ncbi:protein of unknown function [Hathewaya proteolytica DSM 3090]|uniref:DUF4179 domain-containing protein n=1 Tax=Hathewaya proteolytica DSM 3090 TaxID=1121331 RepID=A0A1M6MB33_9CLOT|nr:DUF4179 domain-containing protein [Hathewaya proteolytica]SHJ80682.1 protein of unknown function [Hathewaya proteolytica DSM 3090]
MNQFEKKYIDNIKKDVDIPQVVMQKAEDAFNSIKDGKGIKEMKSKRLKKTIIGLGSAAAVMGAFVCTCFMNPTWASGLPVIGGLFEKYEDKSTYKGNFTEMAEKQRQEALEKDGVTSLPCSKEDGDITFTLKEMYSNDKAMYATIELKNKEGFSTNTVLRNGKDEPALQIYFDSLFGIEDNDMGIVTVNGDFIDENTYEGVFRIGLDSRPIKVDNDKMKLNLNFTKILFSQIEKGYNGDKAFEGNWKFNFDINIDKTQTKTIVLNDIKKNGVGMKSIDVTPYEMILHTADIDNDYDKNPNAILTFPVVFDANGKYMETGMPIVDEYPIYGKDVSKVDIYLCEYNEYLDKLKRFRNEDNFKQLMEEKALYHTTVEIPSLKNK